MYGRNDDGGGNKWIPSERFERVGPNKHKNQAQQRESSKPNTQVSSSSATSASSSKKQNR